MQARKSSEDRARRLKQLAEEPPSAGGVKEITHALGLKNNRVVAAAAGAAAAWMQDSCAEALLAAFAQFMSDPVKRDPGCAAKIAIVQALHGIELPEFEVYLRAARHVQLEPVFGPPEDTAAALRVAAASALAELHYPESDFILADLTQDSNARAREGAIHILGKMGGHAAQLLLRTKARAGDLKSFEDGESFIDGMCLEALMKIDAPGSLEFVVEFLHSVQPLVIEQAALAIGEAKLPESFPTLREAYDGYIQDADRELLLLGMALTRTEESIAFLLGLVREARASVAVVAIEALEFYRDDSKRFQAIIDAAESRSENELRQAIAAFLDSN